MRAYLDHHATAPLVAAAREAMVAMLGAPPGNASSAHADGRHARAALERARVQVAVAAGGSPGDLVFTSGGTEAVHLAVGGLAARTKTLEFWCDPGAHACLAAAMEAAARRHGAVVRWMPATPDGALDLDALTRALGASPLVAVSAVQHETGVISDVSALCRRVRSAGGRAVVDAVQAFGKIPLDVATLGADAVALSAHKIGGPQGSGALWFHGGLDPMLAGGGQERGLRPGTENLVGAVGFGAAAGVLAGRLATMPGVARLRDRVERTLRAWGADVASGGVSRVATVAHAAWREPVEAAEVVAAFDLEGVSISAGSACSSGRTRRSESIARLFPEEPWRASASVRVSLGPGTTGADIDAFDAAAEKVFPRFGLRRDQGQTTNRP